jgi:hypothetical protein
MNIPYLVLILLSRRPLSATSIILSELRHLSTCRLATCLLLITFETWFPYFFSHSVATLDSAYPAYDHHFIGLFYQASTELTVTMQRVPLSVFVHLAYSLKEDSGDFPARSCWGSQKEHNGNWYSNYCSCYAVTRNHPQFRLSSGAACQSLPRSSAKVPSITIDKRGGRIIRKTQTWAIASDNNSFFGPENRKKLSLPRPGLT